MPARFSTPTLAPAGYQGLLSLESYLHTSPLESTLLHLVKLRCSQINGCAFCIDMHWKDLRAKGESEQRCYALDAWREYESLYTPRERAALQWAESVTLITNGHVPDSIYNSVRPHFSDRELADLTLAVAAINAWNRLSIASRTPPGTYTAPAPK